MAKKEEKQDVIVRSVRFNGRSIHIVWHVAKDKFDVTFHENPLPSFIKAMEALAEHVCTLCEMPSKDAAKIEPTGITVNPMEDCPIALITAKKKLKRSGRVFNISTSVLQMYKDPENEGADYMTEAEAAAIEKMVKEAKRYVAGERAQGLLELAEPETKKEPSNIEPLPGMAEPPDDNG